MKEPTPGLFGVKQSNRDFTDRKSWGKNSFNSAFPTALTCFLHSKQLENIYIKSTPDGNVTHKSISTKELFQMDPSSENMYFAFEDSYSPYSKFIIGTLPRVDLVIQDTSTGLCKAGLEVKLTALPDHTTCRLEENKYGSELVIRPDTIVYLACSISERYSKKRSHLLKLFPEDILNLEDWTDAKDVIPLLPSMIELTDKISKELNKKQTPLVVQPVWKTVGKSPELADYCLDVFVWSDIAFTKLFTNAIKDCSDIKKINRPTRTLVWLCRMLLEFAQVGQFDHEKIIDQLSFNTKNDKAFSLAGNVTHPFMESKELNSPRIKKSQVREIILGGGQKLLSPERRFDAIVFNSPDLFGTR